MEKIILFSQEKQDSKERTDQNVSNTQIRNMSFILQGATKGSIAGIVAEGRYVQSPLIERLIWQSVMAWRGKLE